MQMNNTFWKQFRIIHLFLFICIASICCKCDIPECDGIPYCNCAADPIFLIIGEDLSGSHKDFTRITKEDLTRICDALAATNRGAEIAFVTFGNPNAKGFTTCKLKAIPVVDEGAPFTPKAKCQDLISTRSRDNDNTIKKFIDRCESLLGDHKQQHSDINGFLAKAKKLIDAPGVENYSTKMIYINSDGLQDTPGLKSINCDLFPVADVYVSGWKNEERCGIVDEFLSPQQFIDFIETSF